MPIQAAMTTWTTKQIFAATIEKIGTNNTRIDSRNTAMHTAMQVKITTKIVSNTLPITRDMIKFPR